MNTVKEKDTVCILWALTKSYLFFDSRYTICIAILIDFGPEPIP